jgi:hypothetical protein
MISKKMILGSFVAAAAAVVFAMTPSAALADNLTISLQHVPTAASTCVDEAGCDTVAGLPGVVAFNLTGSGFSMGATGSGFPATDAGMLDLSYNLTQLASSGTGTYIFMLSENNLSGPVAGLNFTAIDNGNTSAGVTTSFTVYADESNTLFGTGDTLCTASTPNSPVNLSCGGTFGTGNSTYSLTEKVVITTPAGTGRASGDAVLSPVPEPGTLAMFGSGLLSFAGILRRKLLA